MSVLAADELPRAFEGVAKPELLAKGWRERSMQVSPTGPKRAVPVDVLRRSRRDDRTLPPAFCAEMCACRSGLILAAVAPAVSDL